MTAQVSTLHTTRFQCCRAPAGYDAAGGNRSVQILKVWLASLVILLGGLRGEPSLQEHFVSYGFAKERVIGLLDLPEILPTEGCGTTRSQNINLYGTPSKDRPPGGAIEARKSPQQPQPLCEIWDVRVRMQGGSPVTELPTEESGYEVKAAVVFERADRWFRIALQQGSAWLERENAEGFRSYPDFFKPAQ